MKRLDHEFRLPAASSQIVNRGKPLSFTFEGRSYEAFAGDTIASALAANGITTFSRSFKYHRPRGFVSLAGCEANTLVSVNRVPNVAAEWHVLAEGDDVRAQNYSGSLAFDWNASIGLFGRFLPVGFYYRAFFRPKGAWRFWEPFIRRMAGLGKVDLEVGHGYFDKAYLFADIAVIGGGAAGLSAAIAAAQTGNRVVLIDDHPVLGGALNYTHDNRAADMRRDLISRLVSLPNVRIFSGARCEGLYSDNWLAVVQGRRLHKLRAGRVVIATGAFEQPAVFRNNDLPGIIFGSAAQRLIKLYGVRPGTRAVVFTANDFGYGVALDLAEADVEVAAVIDARTSPPASTLRSAVAGKNIRIENSTVISEASGRKRVRAVRLAAIRPGGEIDKAGETIECDLVCMSAGFAPNLALAAQAGARLVYDARTAMHVADGLPENIEIAGAANCIFELENAMRDGAKAASTQKNGNGAGEASAITVPGACPIVPHRDGKEFVDFDEDLTINDIVDSVASGFDDIQLLKRYSTAGMGPSQGRHSSINTIRLAARARGLAEQEIGTTTARPPYSGISFGALAGRGFEPVRRTSMHRRHLEAGAKMMPAALWMRPAYYGSAAGAATAIAAEVAAVRGSAGLIDVSTLGKIEIRGPGAAEFLNRMYFTGHLKQQSGRARYAVMTDATGTITDDGVICRLADGHFFVTATTSGVEAVVRSMYFWNAQWRLDVDIANVTSAYAAINLAGPHSRAILAMLCDDVDLAPDAFPYMGVKCGHIADVPARILRVGFVGELGYEIHFASGCGEHVWDRLLEAGARYGIRPFGVEAQRVLRLEKGHIILGQDTDGLTNPLEIGMGTSGSSKPFFVGAAALNAFRERGIDRKLVGFVCDAGAELPQECHLVIDNGKIAGRVTSCARSSAAKSIIGLAYVRPHKAEPGQTFSIRAGSGRLVTATVAELPFYDPENERQRL